MASWKILQGLNLSDKTAQGLRICEGFRQVLLRAMGEDIPQSYIWLPQEGPRTWGCGLGGVFDQENHPRRQEREAWGSQEAGATLVGHQGAA